jgi:hypothetical protein
MRDCQQPVKQAAPQPPTPKTSGRWPSSTTLAWSPAPTTSAPRRSSQMAAVACSPSVGTWRGPPRATSLGPIARATASPCCLSMQGCAAPRGSRPRCLSGPPCQPLSRSPSHPRAARRHRGGRDPAGCAQAGPGRALAGRRRDAHHAPSGHVSRRHDGQGAAGAGHHRRAGAHRSWRGGHG